MEQSQTGNRGPSNRETHRNGLKKTEGTDWGEDRQRECGVVIIAAKVCTVLKGRRNIRLTGPKRTEGTMDTKEGRPREGATRGRMAITAY